MTTSPPHIGTLREKPLHASLKQWCAEEGDRFEVKIDRYVIDVVRGDQLIEIQTRGFSSMKKKLQTLLDLGHNVRIVHPIAVEKTIVRLDEDGQVLGRRRSPKHGTVLDIFSELVSFPNLLADPGLEITLVLTIEDEYRKHDPKKAWRRKGWVVQERRLVAVSDTMHLAGVAELAALLPSGLPDDFTTADIASGSGCPRRVAQQMAYCLRKAGAIAVAGKQGNSIEYRLTDSAPVT